METITQETWCILNPPGEQIPKLPLGQPSAAPATNTQHFDISSNLSSGASCELCDSGSVQPVSDVASVAESVADLAAGPCHGGPRADSSTASGAQAPPGDPTPAKNAADSAAASSTEAPPSDPSPAAGPARGAPSEDPTLAKKVAQGQHDRSDNNEHEPDKVSNKSESLPSFSDCEKCGCRC